MFSLFVSPGWNDGSKKELQVDWSDQSQIPGDFVPPGGDGDYDVGSSGVQCYECQGCDVDYFDPDSEFASVQAGCYTCSKTWRDRELYNHISRRYTEHLLLKHS